MCMYVCICKHTSPAHFYTLIHACKQTSYFLLHVLRRLQRMCLQPPEACPPCNTHTACHHIHVPHAYKPVKHTHMLLLTALEVMWGPGTRPQAASWSDCRRDTCSGTHAQGWELWLSNVWLHKLGCSWLCLSLVYYSSLTEAPLQLTSRLSDLSCLGVLHETSTAQTPAALSSLRPTLKCLSATPIT